MADIKTKVHGLDPNVTARDIGEMLKDTENIYLTLNIISKRAQKISSEIKQELNRKLNDFAETSETIEEVHDNKEQTEISKSYERLPNPVIIATDEYLREVLTHEVVNKREADFK